MDLERFTADFAGLTFDVAADHVLRITLDGPGLNAVGPDVHRELADVWLAVDRDPDVRRRHAAGAGKGFSAGGSFELIDGIIDDYATRLRVMREAARPRASTSSTARSRSCRRSTARPSAPASSPALLADVSVVGRTARIIDGHTRLGVAAGDHAAICWPLLCGMAKAKYYLLTCDTLTGEEAERIGLVSLCVDDDEVQDRALAVATQLAGGCAVRDPLDEAHAEPLVPRRRSAIFDASLAYEFLGFGGPDADEGLASHPEKRPAATSPARPRSSDPSPLCVSAPIRAPVRSAETPPRCDMVTVPTSEWRNWQTP